MKPSDLPPTAIVYLHGWYTDEEGNDTHTDDPNRITDWCVYVIDDETNRHPLIDEDFHTLEKAQAFADDLAAPHDLEIRSY